MELVLAQRDRLLGPVEREERQGFHSGLLDQAREMLNVNDAQPPCELNVIRAQRDKLHDAIEREERLGYRSSLLAQAREMVNVVDSQLLS